jgi:hypothetical protein
MQLKN